MGFADIQIEKIIIIEIFLQNIQGDVQKGYQYNKMLKNRFN